MWLELLVRYLHFLAIFGVASTLILQFLSLKPILAPEELRRIAKIDGFYGGFAVLTFIAGLSLWLFVGKSASFYTSNWIFHVKLTLFVVMALLSIAPTVFFVKHRYSAVPVAVPKYIKVGKHIELTLLALIPLLAVLMSRGVGLAD